MAYSLVLLERTEAGALDRTDMYRNIIAAIIGADEAITFASLYHFTLPVATSRSRFCKLNSVNRYLAAADTRQPQIDNVNKLRLLGMSATCTEDLAAWR